MSVFLNDWRGRARGWLSVAVAAAAFGTALPSQAWAGGSVGAECSPSSSSGFMIFSYGNEAAQTFTASKGGKLLTAEMGGIYRFAGDGDDATVRVYAADSGGPTGPALATSTIPGSAIPTNSYTTLTADFPPATAAYLEPGQQYALSLSSTDSQQNSWNMGSGGCPGNAFLSSGGPFNSYPDYDLGFKAYLGPPNDDFAKAQVLTGAVVSADGTTSGGTTETDEPDHYVTNPPDSDTWVGDHSVWYSWEAVGNGPVTMDTCTSAIDSILAVYTGSSLAGLSRVGDNNNSVACPSGTYGSELSFTAAAGTTYRIAVGDAGGLRENTFTLAVVGTPDNVAPDTQIDFGPAGPTGDASPSFGFSSSEPGSTFECRLDSAAFAPCSSPKAYSNLAAGPHSFSVRAIDQAANVDQTPAVRNFRVDSPTLPPDATVDGSATARKAQRQKGKRTVIRARIEAGEDLAVAAGGKVRMGKKSFKLKPQAMSVSAGQSTNLKLKPSKSGGAGKIVKALKKGKKATAKLTVKLTDKVGNAKTERLSVKLKR